jgi:AraC-like DNA-binding protein
LVVPRARSGLSGFGVSVVALWPMLHGLRTMGADVEAIVRSVGLKSDELRDPDKRLPFEMAISLSAASAQAVRDAAFGLHLAELYRPGDFGLLDYLAHSSRRLRDALERLRRYNRLLQDVAEIVLDVRSDQAEVWQRELKSVWIPPAVTENALANLIVIGRHLTGRAIVPLSVQFRHPAPLYKGEHERVFGCAVRFEAERDAVVLRTEDLELPLTNADPTLCSILDRHAQHLLDELPPTASFSTRVREMVAQALKDENPTAALLARRLRMSPRTLRRRLEEEGTTYEEVVDQLRRALTERYLDHPDMSLSQIALLLGYSDASAFRRAFRRWHGSSPATYRRHRGAR